MADIYVATINEISGYGVQWSTNRTTWNTIIGAGSSPIAGGAMGVIHTGTHFVVWGVRDAVTSAVSNLTGWSTDGKNWTTNAGPAFSISSGVGYWGDLAYCSGLGLWCAVSYNSVSNQVSTSADLLSWSTPTNISTNQAGTNLHMRGLLAASSSRFVIIGNGTGGGAAAPVVWSSDGSTWHTASTPPNCIGTGWGVTWSAVHGVFVATGVIAGTAVTPVATSPDGDVWTDLGSVPTASGVALGEAGWSVFDYNGQILIGGQYGIVADTGAAWSTTDLSTWTWSNPGGTPSGGTAGYFPNFFGYLTPATDPATWFAGSLESSSPTYKVQLSFSPTGLNNDGSGNCWNPETLIVTDSPPAVVTGCAVGVQPVTAKPAIRQYPRDDRLAVGATRQGPGVASSLQSSIRQGWQGTYA